MNNSFDWTLIRSFLAALEHGSLLGAAKALHSSQPTLGRHIAELESQLGATLFERTGRGLVPTAMAQRLTDAARMMEAGALQLARQALGQQSESTGTVRISASTPIACYLLPPVIAAMRESLPEIQVDLVASNSVSNLLKREADIAIRMVQPDQASLVAKRIGQVRLGIFARRDYLRRRGLPRQAEDLLRHDLIGLDSANDIIEGFGKMGLPIQREHFSFRTDDLIVGWQAVRAGLGIGFVSNYVARTDSEVLPILESIKLPSLPMWLVVHREIRSNRRIRAVYDFLAHHLPTQL